MKPTRLLGLVLLLTAVLFFLKQAHVGPPAHRSWWAITAPVWGAWVVLLVVASFQIWLQARKGKRA